MTIAFRIFCTLVLLFGIATQQGAFQVSGLAGSESLEVNGSAQGEEAQPFVVTSKEFEVSANGAVTVKRWRTRYVQTAGAWREVYHSAEGDAGTGRTAYAGLPDGVFRVAESQRELLSPVGTGNADTRSRSQEFWKNSPELDRIVVMCGLPVYVLRKMSTDNTSAVAWKEMGYSPKTGLTPLLTVQHFRDGSELRVEAINIQFKDVPSDEDLKKLPIIIK